MKGTKALQAAKEGSVIKIADQPGRIHLVWRDRKSGLKRICRPSMLENTYSAEEKEWEIVGQGVNSAADFKHTAADLSLKHCKHCLNYSGISPT